ncbi:hypothetical protein [Heliophilum fasciatum]|uniref:Uncharacterized protein n=1 Tax=Heliophilum fasciatum TaxID=35700 RepID=A0A4R2RJX4_9FIRM|nr:hypothetical protein [Heliophilum fasciatum]MCW2278102.1 hypothetical protein [Heliophilum fasciatum]TCP64172.1 hypothetical protein EDD73_11124 [Heliophilum fasciatum]
MIYNILKLIFLPLMRSNQFTEEELAVQAAYLAKEVQGPAQGLCIASIIAITDKILPDHIKKMLLEVLRMTDIEKWLREEGREEGIKQTQHTNALNALKEGLPPELVVKITGLPYEEVRKLQLTLH